MEKDEPARPLPRREGQSRGIRASVEEVDIELHDGHAASGIQPQLGRLQLSGFGQFAHVQGEADGRKPAEAVHCELIERGCENAGQSDLSCF